MVNAFNYSADSTIVYVDVYQRLADIIQNPSQFGQSPYELSSLHTSPLSRVNTSKNLVVNDYADFDVVNLGCCGTGLVEVPVVCNPKSPVCSNPSKYVFFDSVHPTQAAYTQMFQSLRPQIDGFLKNNHG